MHKCHDNPRKKYILKFITAETDVIEQELKETTLESD
jgi:hypothetical protein